jgi:catalase
MDKAKCPVMGGQGSKGTEKRSAMEEAKMLDSLAQFNREKIPERPVHAKGAGAYGEFEVSSRTRVLRL